MTHQSDPLDAYVSALDAQRQERPEIDEDVRASALAELQGCGGAMCWPVKDGEWLLRADRDEDGPFIDASFVPAPPED